MKLIPRCCLLLVLFLLSPAGGSILAQSDWKSAAKDAAVEYAETRRR